MMQFLKNYWKCIKVLARVKKAGFKDWKTLEFVAKFLFENMSIVQGMPEKTMAIIIIAVLRSWGYAKNYTTLG